MPNPLTLQELNRFFRQSIPKHANYQALLNSVSPQTRHIVDALLAGDVTPQLIDDARFAPPQEFARYTFLRALSGGNPNPRVAESLTNEILGFLAAGLDEFWELQDDT